MARRRMDTGEAQDLLDELKKYCQGELCTCIRTQVFYGLVAGSFGEEIADQFTPHAVMGEARSADFAANATGVAALVTAGALTEPELAEVKAGLLGIEPMEGGVAGAPAEDLGDSADPGGKGGCQN